MVHSLWAITGCVLYKHINNRTYTHIIITIHHNHETYCGKMPTDEKNNHNDFDNNNNNNHSNMHGKRERENKHRHNLFMVYWVYSMMPLQDAQTSKRKNTFFQAQIYNLSLWAIYIFVYVCVCLFVYVFCKIRTSLGFALNYFHLSHI